MPTTITVRGRAYRVEMEPKLDGEIAPFIYNSRGDVAGVVHVFSEAAAKGAGRPAWILGAPSAWTASDIRDALRQLDV